MELGEARSLNLIFDHDEGAFQAGWLHNLEEYLSGIKKMYLEPALYYESW